MRYVDRTTRRLARTIFHLMLLHGPKLEKRQALLFRAVDVGADLFAMAAALARARPAAPRRRGRGAAGGRARGRLLPDDAPAHRRALPRGPRRNDDVAKYATARRLLDGEHLWLERGMTPMAMAAELAAEAMPAAVGR